jgi:hypothetical protein
MARPARAFRNPPAPVGAGDRVNLGVAILSQDLRRVVHINQHTPTRVRGGVIRWLFFFSLVRRRPPGDLVGHLVMFAVRVMSHVISCTRSPPILVFLGSSGSSFPALANDVEGYIATHKQGATWTRVIAKHNAVIPVIPVHLIRSRIPIML